MNETKPAPLADAVRPQPGRHTQASWSLPRRPSLQLLLGGLAWSAATPRPAAADGPFRVGVGKSTDPYAAARRAILASGEWPPVPLGGKTVAIKPNLVLPERADTGITTDPQVTRAVVDLALEGGAARVLIVEGGKPRAHFSACGYDFFRTYDPGGRVALVDLTTVPVTLAPVPDGSAYHKIYMPSLLLDGSTVFISAAKLKCHGGATATLSVKNLFGLPPIEPYFQALQSTFRPRFDLHRPGMPQTIVDLNLLRPVHFAVVDGIWGMEGNGPADGVPVRMDVVVAGRNALAVDRVCLDAMGMAQGAVPHLTLAAARQLGPPSLSAVTVQGDPYTPRPFEQVVRIPIVWPPVASPSTFSPRAGERTSLSYRIDSACSTHVSIVRFEDESTTMTSVRTLQQWGARPAGTHQLTWNGRDGLGRIVPAGEYKAWVQAYFGLDLFSMSYASGWVSVTA